MLRFFTRFFTTAAPASVEAASPAKTPPRKAPSRPPGTHKVTCPNGHVFYSTWYRHPWMDANGRVRRVSPGDAPTLSFPFYDGR
jgi:hypothetical protein